MYILKPSFYDKFVCIGDKCKMTCCGGWGIDIKLSQQQYDKYLTCEGFISECVKRFFEYDKEKDIYKVNFDERNLCPLCNEQQLCEIVRQLGPDAIGEVCDTFPRIRMTAGIMDEFYLSLACPWVVSILMETKDVISFEMKENSEEPEKFEDETAFQLILCDLRIRDRILNFLRNREIDFPFRQFYVEYILEKIKEFQRDGDIAKMEAALDEYLLTDSYTAFYKNMSELDKTSFHLAQYRLYKDALQMFEECIKQLACRDKDYTYQTFAELLDQNRTVGFDTWNMAYINWMNQKEYEFSILLEKISCYDWMIHSMHASKKYYMLHNYLRILVRNILIKQLHILYYSLFGDISDNLSYNIVAMASRNINHGALFVDQLLAAWEKNNILSTGYIYILLQN